MSISENFLLIAILRIIRCRLSICPLSKLCDALENSADSSTLYLFRPTKSFTPYYQTIMSLFLTILEHVKATIMKQLDYHKYFTKRPSRYAYNNCELLNIVSSIDVKLNQYYSPMRFVIFCMICVFDVSFQNESKSNRKSKINRIKAKKINRVQI